MTQRSEKLAPRRSRFVVAAAIFLVAGVVLFAFATLKPHLPWEASAAQQSSAKPDRLLVADSDALVFLSNDPQVHAEIQIDAEAQDDGSVWALTSVYVPGALSEDFRWVLAGRGSMRFALEHGEHDNFVSPGGVPASFTSCRGTEPLDDFDQFDSVIAGGNTGSIFTPESGAPITSDAAGLRFVFALVFPEATPYRTFDTASWSFGKFGSPGVGSYAAGIQPRTPCLVIDGVEVSRQDSTEYQIGISPPTMSETWALDLADPSPARANNPVFFTGENSVITARFTSPTRSAILSGSLFMAGVLTGIGGGFIVAAAQTPSQRRLREEEARSAADR